MSDKKTGVNPWHDGEDCTDEWHQMEHDLADCRRDLAEFQEKLAAAEAREQELREALAAVEANREYEAGETLDWQDVREADECD